MRLNESSESEFRKLPQIDSMESNNNHRENSRKDPNISGNINMHPSTSKPRETYDTSPLVLITPKNTDFAKLGDLNLELQASVAKK